MNIISVDYNSVNSLSGIATFNRNLSKIFENEIGFYTIFSPDGKFDVNEYNLNLPSNIFIRGLNYLSNYRILSYVVSSKVNKEKADVIILNSPSLVRYVNRDLFSKIILVQHQDFTIMKENRSNFSGSHKYLDYVFDKIDFFVALSDSDRLKVIGSIDEKYRKKVVTIKHMISFDDICSSKKNNFSKSLVMAGRLDNKQKRFDLAIMAMSHLPDWTLTIYGDGPDRSYLDALIIDNNLTNVRLAGFTNNIRDVFQKYDIHVMTSDFEGYPISNIEAISLGLPLIIRDTFTSASDTVNGNGILLSEQWSQEEFIDGLRNIERNYSAYSEKSLILSKDHSVEEISKCWKELLAN